MPTFSLVHGAWHGAWCWEPLAARLVAAGHRAVAVDLPCEDVSAGCAEYAETVVHSLAGVDDDVVLVGHSAAGLTMPLIAAARPVTTMVFVSALLPLAGRPFLEQSAAEQVLVPGYEAGVERDELGRRRWFDAALARRLMYTACTDEEAAWAFARLRPQASTMYTEDSPVTVWPDVPMVDVRGSDDHIVSPRWAAAAVPERLGITSVVLAGAGHSVMVSRADALAELLTARR